MNQKELRRLSRGDLLEMMLSLSKENEHLRKDLHHARQQLEDRRLTVEQSGTLAEAAMQLSGVFQAAQDACDRYTLSLRAQTEEALSQAREKLAEADGNGQQIIARANEEAERIRAQANAEARQILAQANAQAKKILEEAEQNRSRQEEKYGWITQLMENSEEA